MLQMGRMEEKDETDLLGSGRSSGTGNLGRFCGGEQIPELKKRRGTNLIMIS